MPFRFCRIVAAITVLIFGLPEGQRLLAQNNPEWTRPFPPFKLIGNIYWVGSYDLSTYLITTPQGHILINTGLGESAPNIKASVEQLGFKMSDVKILTATHGHFDHVAAMADLEEDDGRSASHFGARQGAARVRRRSGFPLGRHAIGPLSAGEGRSHVQGR